MVRAKPSTPAGHGELLASPRYREWPDALAQNRIASRAWEFTVAGRPIQEVRALARTEALALGAGFSARLGVAIDAPRSADEPIVVTGHQPAIYHPGVWVKDFLLQRLADETGGSAIDIVVDTDGFETVAVSSPCLTPDVHRCTQYLAVGGEATCYACSSVPSADDTERWIAAVAKQLESLPAPAIRHHFASYADALRSSLPDANDLAELTTFARRRFEAVADSRYLELPMTSLAASEAFCAFVADLALNPERFADAYNSALGDYRTVNKTRSAAQPFPDLGSAGGRRELPLWHLMDHTRQAVWVEPTDAGLALVGPDGAAIVELPADAEGAITALRACGVRLAPKALALTLFVRTFVADYFIHGVGGGGYDRVTDDVFRRYFGVEPPHFAVASITMYLPLGMHVIAEDEVSAARERLNRLEHNPDAMLSEVEFDSQEERAQALALAAEKTELVAAISKPDADRKTTGLRIKAVNAELAALLAPLREALQADLASLESQMAASEILTDRTYALCFWSPLEVADKAR